MPVSGEDAESFKDSPCQLQGDGAWAGGDADPSGGKKEERRSGGGDRAREAHAQPQVPSSSGGC